MGKFGVEFGPDLGKSRYATMRSRKAAVVDPDTVTFWNTYVSRVELSLPLKQAEEKGENLLERWKLSKKPPKLLIGLLDDGCPFAASHFLKPSAGAVSTRVRAIWDQNQGKPPAQIYDGSNLCVFGQQPADFTYGLEYVRDSVPPSGPRQLGLDEWIKFHSTTGSIDEDGCYADAGFRPRHVSVPRLRATAAIRRVGSRAPILLPAPTWCSCNFPRTASAMRPAYGSRLLFSRASSTSCHLSTR
jgi:hypothetical protein